MDQRKIGKFIAELRTSQAMTQKELAEKLGISDKTVSKWECGRGLPETSLMMALCDQFGVSVNELLSGERLNESLYREKAEENIVTLMQEKIGRKIIFHIAIGLILFVLSFSTIVLAAESIVTPLLMPVTFFWSILLMVANLVAGLVYAIIRKWKKRAVIGIVLFDVIILSVMILVFCMLLIVGSAFY